MKRQDKLLLELAAMWKMAAVLDALGAAGAEDPLVAGVAAVELVLQSNAVAALAKSQEALVQEGAGFGKFRLAASDELHR